MWALAAKLLDLLLGIFGVGKKDPVQEAQKQGERLGQAETQRDSAVQSLKDQDKVDRAGDTLRDQLQRDSSLVRRPDDAERSGFDPDAKQ